MIIIVENDNEIFDFDTYLTGGRDIPGDTNVYRKSTLERTVTKSIFDNSLNLSCT